MFRCKIVSRAIASAGYDAQYAILEVEFALDGQIWQYLGVPEDIWYRLKTEKLPDDFFRSSIQGRFQEKLIFSKGRPEKSPRR
jgi:hypothetical protein